MFSFSQFSHRFNCEKQKNLCLNSTRSYSSRFVSFFCLFREQLFKRVIVTLKKKKALRSLLCARRLFVEQREAILFVFSKVFFLEESEVFREEQW